MLAVFSLLTLRLKTVPCALLACWLAFGCKPSKNLSPITDFTVTPDRIIVAQQMGPARVFKTPEWRMMTPVCRAEMLNSIAVNGNQLICAGSSLTVWDLRESREVRTLSAGAIKVGGAFGSVRFSNSGKWFASITANEDVLLWDTTDWHVAGNLHGPTALYGAIAFSPDGKRLATSGHRLQLWEVATGKLIRTLDETNYTYGPVLFSPDGKLLAAGAQDNTLRVWDVRTGKLLSKDPSFSGYVEGLAFDDGGTHLLVSGGRLRIFELATGRIIDFPTRDARGPVAFLAGDTRAISAAPDGHFMVWRIADRSLEERK